MEWVALITWVLTAGGGAFMLGLWLKNGGQRQADTPGDRIRPPRIFTHFGLAATGLVLWFALLLVVALLGFSMLATWLRERSAQPAVAAATATDTRPAEQHFPTAVVGVHGLLAAVTLILVLLVAAGVGD
jgi:hypothetical protein